MSTRMSSSVVVVEIDTRKGSVKSTFESSVKNQTEQCKQFWKTLGLAPHVESSLYSKEIGQQIRNKPLKPISIDQSRKPRETDPKLQIYLQQLKVQAQIDEVAEYQKKAIKIDEIRKLERTIKEKAHQLTNDISRTGLMKSESESKWIYNLNDSNDDSMKQMNEKINENEYVCDMDELDEQIVKDLN